MKRTAIITILAAAGLAGVAGVALAQQPGGFGGRFISEWDGDGDGAVSLAEARERRGEIFYMFDADEDGVLSAAEFDAMDEHREAEVAAVQAAGGMGQGGGHGMGPGAQAALGGMMRAFSDADGDGSVSETEFLDVTEAWFDRMDRNGDGVVTSADFGRG